MVIRFLVAQVVMWFVHLIYLQRLNFKQGVKSMFITQYYKYELNGIIYVGGNVPEDAKIIEDMDILNAEEGYELVRKSDKEKFGNSLWLHNDDKQDNYEEIKEA